MKTRSFARFAKTDISLLFFRKTSKNAISQKDYTNYTGKRVQTLLTIFIKKPLIKKLRCKNTGKNRPQNLKNRPPDPQKSSTNSNNKKNKAASQCQKSPKKTQVPEKKHPKMTHTLPKSITFPSKKNLK